MSLCPTPTLFRSKEFIEFIESEVCTLTHTILCTKTYSHITITVCRRSTGEGERSVRETQIESVEGVGRGIEEF